MNHSRHHVSPSQGLVAVPFSAVGLQSFWSQRQAVKTFWIEESQPFARRFFRLRRWPRSIPRAWHQVSSLPAFLGQTRFGDGYWPDGFGLSKRLKRGGILFYRILSRSAKPFWDLEVKKKVVARCPLTGSNRGKRWHERHGTQPNLDANPASAYTLQVPQSGRVCWCWCCGGLVFLIWWFPFLGLTKRPFGVDFCYFSWQDGTQSLKEMASHNKPLRSTFGPIKQQAKLLFETF